MLLIASELSIYTKMLTSPWTILMVLLIPLALLAWRWKTYPTMLAAYLFAAASLSTAFVIIFPKVGWVMVALFDMLVVFLMFIDLLSLPRLRSLTIERTMARVASLGGKHPVELQLSYRGKRQLQLEVIDDAADGLVMEPASHHCTLQPNKRTLLSHTIVPNRRGRFMLEYVYLRVVSFGGLWKRNHRLSVPGDLHVYPSIQQFGEYALLARTNRLSLIGVRKTRRAGQENNFERLRDYQEDDTYKHIDWRSTARRQKLTVRQFQADQSQRVIFLLDCGRMMTNQYDGKSLVDYALNSILLLSYVALAQGDSVGLITFSDTVQSYVPPAGGKRQMNRLLHAGFDLFPQMVQSRFDNAFLYLASHCRRRSLVVLVTNVIDQINAEQIQNYLGHVGGAHLPLLVLLRDHSVFQFADNPTPDPEVLYRSAAASQLLLWRDEVIRRVEANGSFVLDVFPEQMTSPLVNQYLEIKARHLL